MATRRQASLYVGGAPRIETLRTRYNPAQARLIPAHVTLCREDETTDWDILQGKMLSVCPFDLTLRFGRPVRSGNFVYLPIEAGHADFHRLRRAILPDEPRRHDPHLTIVHPRNGTCTDAMFSDIKRGIQPFQYTFRHVMLVEQEDGGVWRVLARIDTISGTASGAI